MNRNLSLAMILIAVLIAGCGESSATPTATEAEPNVTEAAPADTESDASPSTTTSAAAMSEVASTDVTDLELAEPSFEPLYEEGVCPFAIPPNEVEGETILCGTVIVPEERAAGAESTIRLAVVVFKATSTNPEPDPVILLSGGPGEKTVKSALDVSLVLNSFRDERDLIIFDQRGVGLSTPALECPEHVDAMFESLDELDSEVAWRNQFDAAMRCSDRLLAEGTNLSAYNTTENAADVDDIRKALGYEEMNLYGGSYGSRLAQAVMRDHPQGVRSVVLGAVLPTDKSFFVHVSSTVVDSSLRLLAACKADSACNEAYPDLQQTLFDTIDRLNAEPVPIEVTNPLDGQTYDTWLTGDSVYGNMAFFLYITDILPVLPQAIHDVANEEYGLMTQLSSTSLVMFDALSRGMEFSVFCAEDLIGVTEEQYLEKRLEMPRQLVGMTDPEDILEYGFFGICKNWPVEEEDPVVKEPVVSDIPTLLLEGEFDPVTPLIYAEEVAQHLSSSYLYEFPGVGHNVLIASSCARQIADQFMDDPTSEPDASCIDAMPGVVFDLPKPDSLTLELAPFTADSFGLSFLAPSEWDRAASGTFVRGQNSLDRTALIIDVLPMNHDDFMALLTSRLGLVEAPEPSGELETDGFVWSLYTEEVQGVGVDVATTILADEETLMIFLQSSVDERASLVDTVFLPVLDSLTFAE
ncbi:MAG TPA: alpha/beta hydrolase [candidate division Zixibacteria bacterium]|nr:alpha/beta hydrolase [candidate division Zixibacteria bacterium]